MGVGRSKQSSVNCEDPLIISARYPSVLELRRDFKRLYDSIPAGKRVSYTIVIDKGDSGQTHVITGIHEKTEAYPKIFQRYFNNKPLELSLAESETIEGFLSGDQMMEPKTLLIVFLIVLAFIYRNEIMKALSKN